MTGLHELFANHPTTLELVAKNLAHHDTHLGMIWDEEKFNAMLAQMRHLFPASLISTPISLL